MYTPDVGIFGRARIGRAQSRLRALRVSGLLAAIFAVLPAVAQGQAVRDLKYEQSTRPLPDGRERWALVVGISTYKNVPPRAQLRFAHRDAEEFARFLRTPQGGGFQSDNIRVLTNESATLAEIRAALHTWLSQSAGPDDLVYLFFAGHAVIAERGEGYFVAHDSDPQNLHATGLSFDEVNQTLNARLRASMIVLFADACHAGSIGWTGDPSTPSKAQSSLEALGAEDRAFLKLLASRPSERSFEDERWGGGHGIFTFSLLNALRGEAERERDGIIRVSELIGYVSRVVPEQTESQQNPRIAGNFEGRLPMAVLSGDGKSPPAVLSFIRIAGPPGTAIYLDERFRGAIRPSGDLSIEEVPAGQHTLSLDLPGHDPFEQSIAVTPGGTVLDLRRSPELALFRLQTLIRQGKLLGPDGAWQFYKSQAFSVEQRPAVDSMIAAALEGAGQECVNDYVQSTGAGLKRAMLQRAVEAYGLLRTMRPADRGLEARHAFCQGRAQIASGEFNAAEQSLRASLAIEPDFACAQNALGVALSRLERPREAREAFEAASRLTPEWALPPLQLAQQRITAGDLRGALPHLEAAVRFNPRAVGARWSLMRLYRVLGRNKDFERQAQETIELEPEYAPAYLELGMYFESRRDYAQAEKAFEAYLVLAPNYADSDEIRKRVERTRRLQEPRPPSLRRPGDQDR
ncbi:MAG: caspase family protein [Bryobacteraceae bacterium]